VLILILWRSKAVKSRTTFFFFFCRWGGAPWGSQSIIKDSTITEQSSPTVGAINNDFFKITLKAFKALLFNKLITSQLIID
jgi:hypothetical protein